jgi:hypothetical protein
MFTISIGFEADSQVDQAIFARLAEMFDDGERAGQLFQRLLRLSPGVRAAQREGDAG